MYNRRMNDDDLRLLVEIRSDIVRHPDRYAAGATLLQERFNPARLKEAAFAEVKRQRKDKVEIARARQLELHARVKLDPGVRAAEAIPLTSPKKKTKPEVWTAKREAAIASAVQQAASRFQPKVKRRKRAALFPDPSPAEWSSGARLSQAVLYLLERAESDHTRSDEQCQATLLVSVALWDENADERCELLRVFGPWDVTPGRKVEDGVGRWAAASLLEDDDLRERWMRAVRAARETMQGANAASEQPEGKSPSSPSLPVGEELVEKIVDGLAERLKPQGGEPSPPTSNGNPAKDEPEGMKLNASARQAAAYIRDNPGCTGKEVAGAIKRSECYFRRDIVPQLKSVGFVNKPGKGYFAPAP